MKLSKVEKFGAAAASGLKLDPHQERDVRIVLGHRAGRVFHAEHFAEDQLVACLTIFAHHALIVGVGGVFGKDIFDVATFLGSIRRLVDAAHPLLLHRHRIDGGDLDRVGGECAGGQATGHGKRGACAHALEHGAARWRKLRKDSARHS
jgi:hypothetical protein